MNAPDVETLLLDLAKCDYVLRKTGWDDVDPIRERLVALGILLSATRTASDPLLIKAWPMARETFAEMLAYERAHPEEDAEHRPTQG